jgi:hypothetical protein
VRHFRFTPPSTPIHSTKKAIYLSTPRLTVASSSPVQRPNIIVHPPTVSIDLLIERAARTAQTICLEIFDLDRGTLLAPPSASVTKYHALSCLDPQKSFYYTSTTTKFRHLAHCTTHKLTYWLFDSYISAAPHLLPCPKARQDSTCAISSKVTRTASDLSG